MKATERGVSLIELLIVLAVMGILLAICYPSYQQYVLRSYRTEAISGLLQLANAQEHYLADNGIYATELALLGLEPSTRYQFNLTVSSEPPQFELAAQAQGQQQADTECQLFTLNNYGQRNQHAQHTAGCWD